MFTDRPLRIEVLLNSPGPHAQVRILDPFLALKQLGIDCRIHERPFRFSQCIRPHSIVIWQRPLPQSQLMQWEHLQWLRERGCLLLTEWDDHPNLFPPPITTGLHKVRMAPLEICHVIHTSNRNLANYLSQYNPFTLIAENNVKEIPSLNIKKHKSKQLRVFIGNLNRSNEHMAILDSLNLWLKREKNLTIIVVSDRKLINRLPPERVEGYNLLNYKAYRHLLSTCHIALLPLKDSCENKCKTMIKLWECSAESVATIGGPCLYNSELRDESQGYASSISGIIPLANTFAYDLIKREHLVRNSHAKVISGWSLEKQLKFKLWQYKALWRIRKSLDGQLVDRLSNKNLPCMNKHDFIY